MNGRGSCAPPQSFYAQYTREGAVMPSSGPPIIEMRQRGQLCPLLILLLLKQNGGSSCAPSQSSYH